MLNSRFPLVTETCSSLRKNRHPLLRTYGANLPISLGWVVPKHLRLLNEPTCGGSRYGHKGSLRSPFSRAPGIGRTPHTRSYSYFYLLLLITRLRRLPYLTYVDLSRSVRSTPCVTAIVPLWHRNINRFPFQQLRLRAALGPADRQLTNIAGKPLGFRW